MIYKLFFSWFLFHIIILFLLGGLEITCWQRFTYCSQWYRTATFWILWASEKIFLTRERYQDKSHYTSWSSDVPVSTLPDSSATASCSECSSHQAAAAPGPPIVEDAVLWAGQPALPGPQWHLLWITEVVLHRLWWPIYGVEHAPVGKDEKHRMWPECGVMPNYSWVLKIAGRVLVVDCQLIHDKDVSPASTA